MNRDRALPYILAENFLAWWREMGEPELESAFLYWADRHGMNPRRKENVRRKVEEMRKASRAA